MSEKHEDENKSAAGHSVSYNFEGMLKSFDGGEWEECGGPDSGVGLDYTDKIKEAKKQLGIDLDKQ